MKTHLNSFKFISFFLLIQCFSCQKQNDVLEKGSDKNQVATTVQPGRESFDRAYIEQFIDPSTNRFDQRKLFYFEIPEGWKSPYEINNDLSNSSLDLIEDALRLPFPNDESKKFTILFETDNNLKFTYLAIPLIEIEQYGAVDERYFVENFYSGLPGTDPVVNGPFYNRRVCLKSCKTSFVGCDLSCAGDPVCVGSCLDDWNDCKTECQYDFVIEIFQGVRFW
jgi:hypothetical protein